MQNTTLKITVHDTINTTPEPEHSEEAKRILSVAAELAGVKTWIHTHLRAIEAMEEELKSIAHEYNRIRERQRVK